MRYQQELDHTCNCSGNVAVNCWAYSCIGPVMYILVVCHNRSICALSAALTTLKLWSIYLNLHKFQSRKYAKLTDDNDQQKQWQFHQTYLNIVCLDHRIETVARRVPLITVVDNKWAKQDWFLSIEQLESRRTTTFLITPTQRKDRENIPDWNDVTFVANKERASTGAPSQQHSGRDECNINQM